MNTDSVYKLSKYVGLGIIMYLVFTYVPKEPMKEKDALLITIILVLLVAIFENLHSLYGEKSTESFINKQCTTQCQNPIEHMGSVPSIAPSQTDNVSVMPQSMTPSVAPSITPSAIQSVTPSMTPSVVQQESSTPPVTQNPDSSYTVKPERNPQAVAVGSRSADGVMGNEDSYNYTDYNTLPVNLNEGTFEYGYSFLPPKYWYPTPPHPPVCVSDKKCPVCPVYLNVEGVELKEWNSSRRISPPDEINTKYIEDKLNSGR